MVDKIATVVPPTDPNYSYREPAKITDWTTNAVQAFVDVSPSHPFYSYAQWAYYEGIAEGTVRNGKRYLDPDKPATRLDAAFFFQRAFQYWAATIGPNTKLAGHAYPLYESRSFKDVPTTHYGYKYVCWFTTTNIAVGGGYNSRYNKGTNLGIASGYPDNTFRPNELVPRWVIATFWERLMKYAWRGA